jgi:hypothetical protein
VSTQYTQFNWELVFEAQSGKPFPVKLEIVSYNASRTPSNGQTILPLSFNTGGLNLEGNDTIGCEQRERCRGCPALSFGLLSPPLSLTHTRCLPPCSV